MKVPVQVRIDENLKHDASILFRMLGLDLSTAITLFLNQCVKRGGIPFTIEEPHYSKETLESIKEAKEIANDPKVKGYKSTSELYEALTKDDNKRSVK